MHLFRVNFSIILFALASTGTVLAQSGPDLSPTDEFLENLREGEPASADNKSFDERIAAEISRLNTAVTGSNLVAQQGTLDFVKRFSDQYNNPKNSTGFKEKFAERTSLLFVEQFNRGAELDPLAARAMAKVLSEFGSVFARDALLAGLKSADQVVRYRCAKGLARIIDAISADARLTQVTLDALAESTATETSAVVASAMYEAMGYGKEHSAEVLVAMLKALDGRLAQMRASLQAVDGAEIVAIQYFAGLSNLSSDDKVEIVKRLAVLLRVLVEAYADVGAQTSGAEARRDILEQTIMLTEELIESIVKPTGKVPSVRAQISIGVGAVPAMMIELYLWVGTDQAKGALNAGPWDVPVGAP